MEIDWRSSFVPLLAALIILGVVSFDKAQAASDKATMADIKKETGELLQALKGYSAEKRDEAARQARESLEKLDKRIDDLEKTTDRNWEMMDEVAREKARTSLQALRQQRNKVAEWYGGLKNSSAEAWEEMKKGFSSAYQDLQDAWEKSEQEFESSK